MNICKKIISTICASVFAFSCFGFNTNAEYSSDLVYPVKVTWVATDNTTGTDSITGYLNANIVISENRNSVRLVTTEDFEVWFPIRIFDGLDQFVDIKYERILTLDDIHQGNSGTTSKPKYYYYVPAKLTGSVYTVVSDIEFNKTYTFSAGSIIPAGYVLYEIYGGNGMKYFMKNTDEVFYGDEKDQYINQLESENTKLKAELESYKIIDFDEDGLLTNADAQMILVYYTDSLVGKTTGKVEDYSEYVKQISG